MIFGRPFVKLFALCYQTVVCLSLLFDLSRPALSVTLVYCGQTVGWIKMKLGMQVGLGPTHIVLDGDPTPLPKGAVPKEAEPPQFSAYIYCCQLAGWIKISLGTEVGLDPSNIVLDGHPAPPPHKGTEPLPTNFRPMSIVAKRLDGSRCHLTWTWALVQATLC